MSPDGFWGIYYDPALVPALKRAFLSVVPGKGYVEENELAEKLRVSAYKIRRLGEKMCPAGKNWVAKCEREYRDPAPLFFYHPQLAAKITEIIYGDEKNFFRVDALKAILDIDDDKYDEIMKRGLIVRYLVYYLKRKLIRVSDIPAIQEVLIPPVKWRVRCFYERMKIVEPYRGA